mmetsp:Transcript_12326/g.32023  ORF Transcript_12326/g.32023 Transcript_12326/m.32023 type:complete len:212 (-) Transcript_12326:381-1016(-)
MPAAAAAPRRQPGTRFAASRHSCARQRPRPSSTPFCRWRGARWSRVGWRRTPTGGGRCRACRASPSASRRPTTCRRASSRSSTSSSGSSRRLMSSRRHTSLSAARRRSSRCPCCAFVRGVIPSASRPSTRPCLSGTTLWRSLDPARSTPCGLLASLGARTWAWTRSRCAARCTGMSTTASSTWSRSPPPGSSRAASRPPPSWTRRWYTWHA